MRILFVLSLLLDFIPTSAQHCVEVTNPSAVQRHEVIELDGSLLPDTPLVVRDAFGIACPWQLTHDGKLLLYASVRPLGQAVYTIQHGQSQPMQHYVTGRYYPERADDISFENDRAGFRIYGPETQRRGEQSFGIDLWVKRSSEPVLDSLYRWDISDHVSYHLDHGSGMDAYGVGPTLGCGTPALMVADSICYPWCYESYQILDHGPLRFTVQLDFPQVVIRGMSVREHRVLSLDRGSNFCKVTVWYDGIDSPLCLAAGFAMRTADTSSVMLGDHYIHYADPTVDASRHNSQIYVGLVFPDKVDVICTRAFPEPVGINYGHGLGIVAGYTGYKYTYYIGMAWSDFDVRSWQEWHVRVEQFLNARQSPLTWQIKKAG